MEEQKKELVVNFSADIGTISSKEFAKIKKFVDSVTATAQNAVVTAEGVRTAKDDLANLRKLYGKLEDERKRIKREWEQPYKTWEADYKKAVEGINSAIANLDTQVKTFDAEEKQKLLDEVKASIWTEAANMDRRLKALTEEYPVVFARIFRDEYGNKSLSVNKRTTEIRENLRGIMLDLDVIGDDRALLALYVDCGNLSQAQLMKKEQEEKARRFAEAQKKLAEEPVGTCCAKEPAPQVAARYTFGEITIAQVDENSLDPDELRPCRLKRIFIGPKYKLLALMDIAQKMGIELIKEEK